MTLKTKTRSYTDWGVLPLVDEVPNPITRASPPVILNRYYSYEDHMYSQYKTGNQFSIASTAVHRLHIYLTPTSLSNCCAIDCTGGR